MVTWMTELRTEDLTPVVPIVPKIRSLQPELDSFETGNASSDACLREAYEVETKDNLLKQVQEYLASIQTGWASASEQQRAHYTNKVKSNWKKFRNSLALKSELATDATQSLQEEQEALTEHWQKLSFKRKTWTVILKLWSRTKMSPKGTNLQEHWQTCDFNRRNVRANKLWAKQMLNAWRNDLPSWSRRASVAIADWTRGPSTVDVEQLAN